MVNILQHNNFQSNINSTNGQSFMCIAPCLPHATECSQHLPRRTMKWDMEGQNVDNWCRVRKLLFIDILIFE